MSFAGIIETVLIGLIVALASDKDSRDLLMSSDYFPLLASLVGLGFACYIITAILSLMAFRKPKWTRTPQMPDPDPIVSINYFFSNPDKYKLKMFAIQMVDASSRHRKTNSKKYDYFTVALIFLMIGIMATSVGGFIMLL
jgi:hypothetical protein